MAETLTKLAYQTMQQGKSLMGLFHKETSTRLMELFAPQASPRTEPLPTTVLNELRASMERLIERDWQEAEAGIYPSSLLFDAPWLDWATRYPLLWLDLPQTWNRRQERNVRDLPIPTDWLKVGYNEVTFEAVQHYTYDCEDPSSPELWTDINTQQSRVSLQFDEIGRAHV